MKRIKLKKWVRKTLIILLGITFIILSVNAYQNRIKRIENGSFVLINDNEIDK